VRTLAELQAAPTEVGEVQPTVAGAGAPSAPGATCPAVARRCRRACRRDRTGRGPRRRHPWRRHCRRRARCRRPGRLAWRGSGFGSCAQGPRPVVRPSCARVATRSSARKRRRVAPATTLSRSRRAARGQRVRGQRGPGGRAFLPPAERPPALNRCPAVVTACRDDAKAPQTDRDQRRRPTLLVGVRQPLPENKPAGRHARRPLPDREGRRCGSAALNRLQWRRRPGESGGRRRSGSALFAVAQAVRGSRTRPLERRRPASNMDPGCKMRQVLVRCEFDFFCCSRPWQPVISASDPALLLTQGTGARLRRRHAASAALSVTTFEPADDRPAGDHLTTSAQDPRPRRTSSRNAR
jgi:hypothetical protein